ncbi:MAG TPA: 30S ribosomal protein S18 [Longimicrobiales bacterium]|nr:30S ribosomal protein S18 [Longimicrobiales bacterium]
MARGNKPCPMCEAGIRWVNYKDEKTVSRFVTDRGKILPRRMTGMCARHQRQMGTAVKRARYLALVPYLKTYEV